MEGGRPKERAVGESGEGSRLVEGSRRGRAAEGRFGSCWNCYCISIFNDSKIQPLTCQRQR